MEKWSLLKEAISNAIKDNNNQEITGDILQSALLRIIDSVGENATFVGIATPTTIPGLPDGSVFYFAATQGVYSNFGGIEVKANELAILLFSADDQEWVKHSLNSEIVSEIEKLKAKQVLWDYNSNMDDFKDAGIYEIYGERTNILDNLPISNAAPGHSVSARLTVIASTLRPQNNEICITQFLQLSNRLGRDGNSYVRTYNENNGTVDGWTSWQKLQGVIETQLNSDNFTGYVRNSVPILGHYLRLSQTGNGLNGMIDNGMYSGTYADAIDPIYDSASGFAGYGLNIRTAQSNTETFILIVINDYSIAGQFGTDRHISQLKYAINTAGKSTITRRVGVGADDIIWGEWEDVGYGERIAALEAVIQGPNMVGKFAADSTHEDWYWWPNGTKVAIPVDAASGEFSYYFDGEITEKAPFAPRYEINSGMPLLKYERLDKIPPFAKNFDCHALLASLFRSTTCPIIDCANFAYNSINYLAVNNSEIAQFSRVHFINTENVIECKMIFNLNAQHRIKYVTGLDLSSCKYFVDRPLGKNSAPFIEIKNLGKAQEITDNVIDCRAIDWGDDRKADRARQSLVDSLLTYSFNRASAGYSRSTIQIYRVQYNRLTADEIASINAKGYDIAVDDTYTEPNPVLPSGSSEIDERIVDFVNDSIKRAIADTLSKRAIADTLSKYRH